MIGVLQRENAIAFSAAYVAPIAQCHLQRDFHAGRAVVRVEHLGQRGAARFARGTRQQAFVEIDVALARIALELGSGQPAAALAQADEEARRLEEMGGVIWLPEVLRARAHALEALGRPAEALADLVAAADVTRAAGARGMLWSHLADLAGAQARHGDAEAAAETQREAAAELAYVRQNTWPDELRAVLEPFSETH